MYALKNEYTHSERPNDHLTELPRTALTTHNQDLQGNLQKKNERATNVLTFKKHNIFFFY